MNRLFRLAFTVFLTLFCYSGEVRSAVYDGLMTAKDFFIYTGSFPEQECITGTLIDMDRFILSLIYGMLSLFLCCMSFVISPYDGKGKRQQ